METSISHISIIVKSEASLEFYSRLGFKEIRRIIRTNDTVVLMDGNGIGLELFIDPRHPDRATEPETCGIRYFAIKVSDFDTINKEINCGSINTDWYGKRYCFTYDPDGLPIQLHE